MPRQPVTLKVHASGPALEDSLVPVEALEPLPSGSSLQLKLTRGGVCLQCSGACTVVSPMLQPSGEGLGQHAEGAAACPLPTKAATSGYLIISRESVSAA